MKTARICIYLCPDVNAKVVGGEETTKSFSSAAESKHHYHRSNSLEMGSSTQLSLEQRHKTNSAKAAWGFLRTHLERPPQVPKERAERILVGSTTAKTTGGRWMILQVFIKKFFFHEIKAVSRPFPSFYSFIRTTFASRTCARLHAAAGLDIRGASQPGNYHQEDKIQGSRVQDGSLQEQQS